MRWVLSAAVLVSVSGCTFSLDWLRHYQAQRYLKEHDYASALPILQQIVDLRPDDERALTAARQGARAAHLEAKNYLQAVKFYRHVVLKSDQDKERKSAQSSIAQIYFENLKDYNQAVMEYEKLLKLSDSDEDSFRYRLNLAKSHMNLNNVEQALTELNVLLEKKPGSEEVFEIKMLKGNVLVANKQLQEAAALWEGLLKEFPERSRKENVGLNLVVSYEDLKEFDKAIAVLESMRAEYPNPEFLDQRIERLKERQYNLPGAQGWKR